VVLPGWVDESSDYLVEVACKKVENMVNILIPDPE